MSSFSNERYMLIYRFVYVVSLFIIPSPGITGTIMADSGWLQKEKDLFGGVTGGDSTSSQLSIDTISDGLKDALRAGIDTVVMQLGTSDGFNGDPDIHIPLPDNIKIVNSMCIRTVRHKSTNE